MIKEEVPIKEKCTKQDYDDGTGKKELSDKYGLNVSMISKWVRQKEAIISEATKGEKS